jgi:hypothetical protein
MSWFAVRMAVATPSYTGMAAFWLMSPTSALGTPSTSPHVGGVTAPPLVPLK